jgi:sialate O-acetylesterase
MAAAGEANTDHDGRQYNCSFPAMVKDWRAKFHAGTDGAASGDFPFGYVQINGLGNASTYPAEGTPNDPSMGAVRHSNSLQTRTLTSRPLCGQFGQWERSFPAIRYVQTLALTALKEEKGAVFMSVALDTPVRSGSVHSPFKQPVASRLARVCLAEAYGMSTYAEVYPWAASASTAPGNESQLLIQVNGVGPGGLFFVPDAPGFEVLVPTAAAHGTWFPVAIIDAQPVHATDPLGKARTTTAVANTSAQISTITIGPVPADVTAVRYLWRSAPCSNDRFQCPVYARVEPLGPLTGELDILPLPPFLMAL